MTASSYNYFKETEPINNAYGIVVCLLSFRYDDDIFNHKMFIMKNDDTENIGLDINRIGFLSTSNKNKLTHTHSLTYKYEM